MVISLDLGSQIEQTVYALNDNFFILNLICMYCSFSIEFLTKNSCVEYCQQICCSFRLFLGRFFFLRQSQGKIRIEVLWKFIPKKNPIDH
jgi:hypothetical protein